MTDPKVTLEQLEPAPAVTLAEEVTGSSPGPLAAVTRSGDARWQILIQECLGACTEIQGVLAGFDEFSHLPTFPKTKIHVLDAGHDLRRALLHMEDAIHTLSCELPAIK